MKIVTDSAADLTAEDIRANDITIAPLYIQFPEGEISAEAIAPDDFYRRLAAMQPKTPTTAQPSPGVFKDLYNKILASGEEVLSIHISSGLSGTINSARTAAGEIGSAAIHIIDSLTLSGGQRFQILAAARALKAGWSLPAIQSQLAKIGAASEVAYTLDTLDYLARGGRIGRVQALASALLNIKPIINVSKKDGKYNTVGKSRSIGKAVQDLTRHLETLYADKEPLWVSVVHGNFAEQAAQLQSMLQAALPIAKLELLRISPVLGVHTGPGIVGATVVPMRLFEEIG